MITQACAEPLRALLVEGIHPNGADILTDAGLTVERIDRALDAEELLRRLDGVAVLGLRSDTHVPAHVLAEARELRVIGAFCMGTDQVDLHAATEGGVPVFNAPFANTRSVVELAVAEIIALTRRLTVHNDATHAGQWNKSTRGSHELRGRRLGIVGYGKIGSQLSVLAEALGMHVLFHDTDDKLARGNAGRCPTLDALLSSVDVVTLHVNGRPGESGVFGEEEFSRMLPGALFLNLSRGFAVDQAALRRHIDSGHLAGAAIDVFPDEPAGPGQPFDSALRGLSNVILTPHVAGATEEAERDIGEFVAHKIVTYLRAGKTTLSVNFPEVQLPRAAGRTRILLTHRNRAGVLAALNRILAARNLNVEQQALSTIGGVGYAVTDVSGPGTAMVSDELFAMPETIRVEVLPA